MNTSRRDFLSYAFYSGAFVMLAPFPTLSAMQNPKKSKTEVSPMLKINEDNSMVFYYPSPEMGQGVDTSLTMLFMEELGGDMANVSVEPLPLSIRKDDEGKVSWVAVPQGAGGSTSVSRNWNLLRNAGASARQLFLLAAATYWNKPISDLSVKDSYVLDAHHRKISFGQLAQLAAQQQLPEDFQPQLKPSVNWDTIGKPQRSLQLNKIVTGEPLYGMDIDYPGAKVCLIARCPFFDGFAESFDASEALKQSGVLTVVELPRPALNKYYTYLAAGIAVVANDFWTAKKARDLLKIKWAKGPHFSENTAGLDNQCLQLLAGQGQIVRNDGDFSTAIANADKVIKRNYQLPLVSHAQLEPQNCIAHVTENNCTVIGPVQSPSGASRVAESITGFDRVNMDIRYTRLGGAFGRHLTSDHVAEAVTVSKLSQLPIKLIYTREDDLSHDFYRPMGHHQLIAGADKNGKIVAWTHRLAGTPKYYRRDNVKPEELFGADMYIDDFPATLIPNLRLEYFSAKSGAPQGSWRAPAHTANSFVVQSFINEIASELNQDLLSLRLALLGEPRDLQYGQHGGPVFNTGRMINVLKKVAKLARWGRKTPKNIGLGIAAHFTFGGYCAQIVEVELIAERKIKIHRVYCALDVGTVVNPQGIRAQIEGGINDGISAALGQKIVIENGQVLTKNFDTYNMTRIIDSATKIDSYIVKSDAAPAGAGEMATPPLAPALADAIESAGGARIRKQPMREHIRRVAI